MNYTTIFDYPALTSEFDYKMYFNQNFAIATEVNIAQSSQKNKTFNNSGGGYNSTTDNFMEGRKNLTPFYFYNTRKEFYFRTSLDNQPVVVKEDYEMIWELHPDIEVIGEFECKKATTHFRGNEYVAWYTPEIPVPFGPWKFRGLPGLIIKVYDINKKFSFLATKIVLSNEARCVSDRLPTDIDLAVSLEVYVQRKNKIADDFFAKLSSKQPKGSPPLKRSKNCDDCGLLEVFPE